MGATAEAETVININGYALSTQFDDGVARVRDVELAERLGYTLPRQIRRLIRNLIESGKLSDVVQSTAAVLRDDGMPSKPATVYWLTEAQALKVIAKSETATADRILDEVIAVFVAWRHGRLSAAQPANDNAQVLELVSELRTQVVEMRAALAALGEGVISATSCARLRADIRRLAALEVAARRFTSVRAATRDIDNELISLTGWGGRARPWKYLPVTLLHVANAVLRARESSVRREMRVLESERQYPLPHVSTKPERKAN